MRAIILAGALLCVPSISVRAETLPDVPLGALVAHALRTLQPITEAVERELARGILEATKKQELADARAYLVRTATPGGTMLRDGPGNNIAKLHPVLVLNLRGAIEEARASGLPRAGIYSAYRAPGWGVGGFRDKHLSLHAYGLAVDMTGIGRPGSDEARKWLVIAWRHRLVNPYGWRHRREWNHFQAASLRLVGRRSPLRSTITAKGPIDLPKMWQVAQSFIAATSFAGQPPEVRARRYARRHVRRVRYAAAR